MHRRLIAIAIAIAAFTLPAAGASASSRVAGPAATPAGSSLQTHCSIRHAPRHLRHSRRR